MRRSTTLAGAPRCGALVLLLALVGLLPSWRAAASEPIDSPRAADEEAEIDHRLARARSAARTWHYAWLGIFGATFAGQGVVVAVVSDDDARLGAAFGAVPPAVGLTLAIATAPAALRLDADLRALEGAPEAARLEAKRALLRRYADSESEPRNLFAHLGPLFLNLSVATLTWLVAGQPVAAGIQLGAGTLLSELRVWTSPRVATNAVGTRARATPRLVPFVAGTSVGLQLSLD